MEIKSRQHRFAPQPLFLILAIWLVSFVTWTLPDRDVPSSIGGMDLLALAKVAIRGAFLVLIGWTVACYMRLASTRRRVWLHLPLCLFVGWCIVSVAWSPLKAISLGQALGQLLLLLISINVALCCRNPDYQSKILFQLCLMSVAFSLTVMLLHYAFPDWATLDREEYLGLFHPTNVASTASLGLLLLLGCALVLDYSWAHRLLLVAVPVHVWTLWLAENRLSVALNLVVAGCLVLIYGNRAIVAGLSLATAVLIAGLLMVDPGLQAMDPVASATGKYASRGQSADQIAAFSGRDEMWRAMWTSYLDAPWKGHGYFVCSSTGSLDVWDTYSNHKAHNLVLQALVSTGIIGLALLLAWYLGLVKLLISPGVGPDRRYNALFVAMGVWFLGWSLLNSSYLGPVRAESVVFACLTGLLIHRVAAATDPPGPATLHT